MQPIIVPAIDAAAPAAVHEHAAAIASRVARLEKSRGEVDAAVDSLRQSPLDTVGVFRKEDHFRETALDDLAVELHIRQDIKLLLAEHHDALAVLRREAFEAFERTKTEIEAKLVELGFHPVNPSVLDPHRIQPGWILAHPAVRQARDRDDELSGKTADRSAYRANEAAIVSIEAKIKGARARLGAV